ncbi:BARELY ANY MERISTEM 2 [Hibiscus trionum]|uniref:BARELY ANY MERISTEM 2 n=1 Tax=Hibiscus trionum TaxID=183268 RepID=A0A9W7IRB2_HIBTR|nr:BARELY ANY MERISTEM 2 [Hibiscus trionum]
MWTVPNPCLVLLFHAVLLSLLLLPLKTTCSATTQAEALLQWKNSFSVSPPSLSSWSLPHLHNLCNWTSITCDATTGTVSRIDLSNGNMSGSIAQFNFTPFANITHFNLKSNNFDGPIPIAIGTLAKLVFLDLSDNSFQGSLPVEIGNLKELQYLSLFNNNLNGTIPSQVSNLQKLRYLDLGSNYFVDSDFSAMPLLKHLGLSYNEFKLEFPQFVLN